MLCLKSHFGQFYFFRDFNHIDSDLSGLSCHWVISILLYMLLLSQSILLIFIDLLKYTTNLSCLITIAYLMQIERAYCWSTLYASSFPILAFILANSLVILYLVCRLIFLYCCLYCPNCSNSLFYCFHSSSARITITVKTNDILNFLHLFLK